MTPTPRKNNHLPLDSDGSRRRTEVLYKSGVKSQHQTTFSKAKDIWASAPKEMSVSQTIPNWYAGLHGLPGWYLRQPMTHHRMTRQVQAACLNVRMNYILDYYKSELVSRHEHFFCLPARRLRTFCRSYGPIYTEGSYSVDIRPGGCKLNTSYALSSSWNWKRTLACTTRNFVHFLSYCRSWRFYEPLPPVLSTAGPQITEVIQQ